MTINIISKPYIITISVTLVGMLIFWACSPPPLNHRDLKQEIPQQFTVASDSVSSARIGPNQFFNDPDLKVLIDSALANNQELNIILQEIEIAKNEVQIKKGEYLPTVNIEGGLGVEKAARYTQVGASEATTDIKPGREMPEPLGDFKLGLYARWEVDIWHKLRNAKKASIYRYLSTVEGKNFMITNLIAEIAGSYYELLALDNQLDILQKNIDIQTNALRISRLQKEATRQTELAVRRFEAQLLNSQSKQYLIEQKIVETENRINFLVGRFPQPVIRNKENFTLLKLPEIHGGTTIELLENRSDIRQAEKLLAAAKLEIEVARADFYPSLGLTASAGTQAFNPAYLAKMPLSLFSTLIGEMAGPLINKNTIRANYLNADAKQIQAIINYEKTVLNAYLEVSNQLLKIHNLGLSYNLKSREVEALTESIAISTRLFVSARADYSEILITQRDALESRFDLVETQKEQINAIINTYKALGGGWETTP